MNDLSFPYKPKTVKGIIIVVLLAFVTLIFSSVALDNEEGLRYSSIELSPEGATIFYWFLAVLFLIFTLVWIKGIYIGMTKKREIVLTKSTISAPKSAMSKEIITLKYSEISDISVESQSSHIMLSIAHTNGTLTIPQGLLPNKQSFNELVDAIKERLENSEKE